MSAAEAEPEGITLFQYVGGTAWFEQLVDHFYEGVMADPLLSVMYPADDVAGAKQRLSGFLTQFWGGPDDYSKARGHPMLRARHFPFPIGPLERERWLVHMAAALKAAALPPEVEAVVQEYFDRTATAMMNRD